MRLLAGLVLGALLGAVVAAIVWLLAFGDVRVVEPDAAAPAARGPADRPIREIEAPAARRAAPGENGIVPGPAGDLLVPVVGVAPGDLVDSYTQARAGGGRQHDAIDIPAPEGTPVVAAAPGTVEKLFYSERGGITAYIRSRDGRRIYYYAHLDRYAPGLVEGRELAAGDAIGLVGSTGNADSQAPHLHFAVMRMREGEGWWEGEPINPYPLLVGRD